MTEKRGDVDAFEENWRNRAETKYLHWTRTDPKNQIQLAFRRHWITFQSLIGTRQGQRRCLEVGCGRGSLSAYFSDDGWNCTLLDLSSAAIERAREAFSEADLQAKFDIADCLDMPYADGSFDLVFSIGLLEHFEDIDSAIKEQVRVLAPGGLFIGYVVPNLPDNLQKKFNWVNDLIRTLMPEQTRAATSGKTELFRSDELSPPYIAVMKKLGLQEIGHDGVYSLPMISHSPDFPFSLLPKNAEIRLTQTFQSWLDEQEANSGADPWRCQEGEGQAFLVWGRKPD